MDGCRIGPVTATLCVLAISRRSILLGEQGQGCPPNEPGPATPDLSANPGTRTGKRTR